jgi:hypothetical protein
MSRPYRILCLMQPLLGAAVIAVLRAHAMPAVVLPISAAAMQKEVPAAKSVLSRTIVLGTIRALRRRVDALLRGLS